MRHNTTNNIYYNAAYTIFLFLLTLQDDNDIGTYAIYLRIWIVIIT